MFKRATLTLLMLGTLAISSLAVTSTSEAQRFRGWYRGGPAYSTYYAPRSYSYYTPRYSRWYGAPSRYYYDTPYAPYYYSARPGVQVYFR